MKVRAGPGLANLAYSVSRRTAGLFKLEVPRTVYPLFHKY